MRERPMSLAELLRALPVEAAWKAPETPTEPPTDAVWRWVIAGTRWRSCGCVSAGRTHREEP